MSVLRHSALANRLIRQDENTQLGTPTRPFVEAAVRSGDADEAQRWLNYYLHEQSIVSTLYGVWDWHMVRYTLQRKGNDAWADLLDKSMAHWLGTTAGLPGQPLAQVRVQAQHAWLTVDGLPWPVVLTEDHDHYTLTLGEPEAQAERRANSRQAMDAAILARDLTRFGALLDAHLSEARLIHDILADWAWALLSVIAREWGETILDEVLRVTEEPWVTPRYANLRNMSIDDSLQLTIEGMRGHFSGPDRAGTISVVEEADRYVLLFDACGSGGRMRRGDPMAGSGSRLEAPYHFLNVAGAYDWTWNRTGVCAYCAHCSVVNQILPIEGLGRPMRMTLYPENPQDPCRWVLYKNPQAFPDEAFTSVGKSRPS